jgi:hypothetical protein
MLRLLVQEFIRRFFQVVYSMTTETNLIIRVVGITFAVLQHPSSLAGLLGQLADVFVHFSEAKNVGLLTMKRKLD